VKNIRPIPHALKSHKAVFPFTLALPSFIWSAGYADNVDRLGPLVDEVALLFFESAQPDSPPDASLADELAVLAAQHAVTYNVHLPVDADLGAAHPETGAGAVHALTRVMAVTRRLNPSAWVLHIDPLKPAEHHRRWQDRLIDRLGALIHHGVPPRRLCVETLHYPIEWLAPVIEGLDLGICLDLGHLFHWGLDPYGILDRWGARVGMIHLHASTDDKDHQPLDQLTDTQTDVVRTALRVCRCPVTVEVFSEAAAVRSLAWLDEHMRR